MFWKCQELQEFYGPDDSLIVQPKDAAHFTCGDCSSLWNVGERSWTAGQLKIVKLAVNVQTETWSLMRGQSCAGN